MIMSNVINLNQARKAKTRDNKRQQADENAVKFGRTKAQKDLEKKRADKSVRDLDGHQSE
jgi:hypothetical protein